MSDQDQEQLQPPQRQSQPGGCTAGSCCGSSGARWVFLLSIPVAIAQPVLAQYLWLLALFSVLVIRCLELPEPDRRPPSATTRQHRET